ncbi:MULTISPECIES: hypothetical protein [unclassified Actinoplanes]|uniref:hypothetical protein n=1 Tax=unclassified Actinoplanes TaxID=2626549 RepID=UPI00043A35CC|nr:MULTISPECIES: hypothetical protein [unclassified Actinoplanes]
MAVTAHDVAGSLPDIATLRERCRALAVLEAILSPEEESRYYSFTSAWSEGEELASMDNGSGDAWSIVFSPAGAFLWGFDHESSMSPAVNNEELWPGLVDTVPDVFSAAVNEPAFSYEGTLEATVCLWRQTDDDRWHAGDIDFPDRPDPDGAERLFSVLLDPTGLAYHRFAEDYYGKAVDLDAVREILALSPLTTSLVRRLNADRSTAALIADLSYIGYPSQLA